MQAFSQPETQQRKDLVWEDRALTAATSGGPCRVVPVHHDKCHSKINSLCTFGNYNYHFGVIYLLGNTHIGHLFHHSESSSQIALSFWFWGMTCPIVMVSLVKCGGGETLFFPRYLIFMAGDILSP